MKTNKLGDFKELKKLGRAGYLKCEGCGVEAWHSSKQIQNKQSGFCSRKCEYQFLKKINPEVEKIKEVTIEKRRIVLEYNSDGFIILNDDFKYLVFKDRQGGMKNREIKKKYKVDPLIIDRIFNNLREKKPVTPKGKLWTKIYRFCDNKMNFTPQELMDKISPSPKCYLTGDNINLEDSRSYELDHIIPRSKGGDNSLENCGVTVKMANRVKTDLVIDELIEICEKILRMHKK